MISDTPQVGQICGLWANSLGLGGILPIQAEWCVSTNVLDMKLTGNQGDVMQESMNVSKTVAMQKCSEADIEKLKDKMCKGIHVHCPEGAVPKDGPSAGAAITTCLYSLIQNKPIRHDIGMTGEITLKGEVTAIGGLEYKIDGGVKGGITTFLYPKDNEKDFKLLSHRVINGKKTR